MIAQAQTNFGQYLPVIFLLLGLLEANAVLSERYLLVAAIVITALRIMHTLQLAFPRQLPIGFRMLGFMGTAAFFVVCSVLCILVGLQVCPPPVLSLHCRDLACWGKRASQPVHAGQMWPQSYERLLAGVKVTVNEVSCGAVL